MNTVLAIDSGGTFTKIGIVDDTVEILVSKMFSTKSREPFASFLKELVAKKCSDFRTRCFSLETVGNVSIKI